LSTSHAEPLPRAFWILLVGHLIQALGFALMPLFPTYLGHLGATRAEIGQVMAASSMGGLLLRPLVGMALDRFGRRPTVISGTLAMVVGLWSIGLVTEMGPMAYVARFCFGVGAGTLFAGYFTFASDLIPESRRTEGLAIFGASGLLPMALNPVVQAAGIDAPDLRFFYPVLGCVILTSVFFVWRVGESRDPRASYRTPKFWEIIRAISAPPLLPLWIGTIVFGLAISVFMAFSTVTAAARGVARPAELWMIYAFAAIVIRLLGARWANRVKPRNLITPAVGVYALALVLVAGSTDSRGFIIAGLCAGLGHGVGFPALTSMLVDRAESNFRGVSIAVYTALWEVCDLLLTPTFGAVSDRHGDAIMFSLAALCAVFGLILWSAMEYYIAHRKAGVSPMAAASGISRWLKGSSFNGRRY